LQRSAAVSGVDLAFSSQPIVPHMPGCKTSLLSLVVGEHADLPIAVTGAEFLAPRRISRGCSCCSRRLRCGSLDGRFRVAPRAACGFELFSELTLLDQHCHHNLCFPKQERGCACRSGYSGGISRFRRRMPHSRRDALSDPGPSD